MWIVRDSAVSITHDHKIAAPFADIANRLAKQTPLEHYIYVRRCHVSPTRCILQPPQQEISNSMLRHFALEGKSDRFLRVQFVGDRGDFPASFESVLIDQKSGGKSGVFSRIRRALQHGLDIGGRHYIFLCFGESQVKLSGPKLFTQATPHICDRERGCWMLSEDDDLTVERVLRWMGDLSEERVIAKHAARQGLVGFLPLENYDHDPLKRTTGSQHDTRTSRHEYFCCPN